MQSSSSKLQETFVLRVVRVPLCIKPAPAALAADEIRVPKKKRVVSDAPKAWILGVVSWIFPWFVVRNPADTRRKGAMHTLMEIDIQRHKNVI